MELKKRFAKILEKQIENNKEHTRFVVREMAKLLNKSEKEVLEHHFDEVMTMFIATV